MGTSMSTEIIPVVYSDVRHTIPQGALLQYRAGRKLSNRLIARVGGTPYAHSAMAAWWGSPNAKDGVLMVLETLQFKGGRAVILSSQVRGWPGQWDVYEVRKPFDAEAAVQSMIRTTGIPYGWWNLLRAGVRHLPLMYSCLPQLTDDELDGSFPTCSPAVSRACRAGGRDPRPGHADVVTEPGHLVDPDFSRYLYTLFSTHEQVSKHLSEEE